MTYSSEFVKLSATFPKYDVIVILIELEFSQKGGNFGNFFQFSVSALGDVRTNCINRDATALELFFVRSCKSM